jgi:hypothetical protein
MYTHMVKRLELRGSSPEEPEELCESNCRADLENLRTTIKGACTNEDVVLPFGSVTYSRENSSSFGATFASGLLRALLKAGPVWISFALASVLEV